ncbi:hypothetical protein [Gordonia sp. CPCC 205333]|uniref:hypothetical protein n=1 Tax=Gordonia sp. CPCC 205333 TaxID=3140790 RepID=UPI003AF39246
MRSRTGSPVSDPRYCLLGQIPPEKPIAVLLLESDIGEPPEYWHLLVDRLASAGLLCLIRIRPGYLWRPTGGADIIGREFVTQLVTEAETLIYLAHSLGALMAILDGAARPLHSRIPDTVMLLDPATPEMIAELRSNKFELGRIRRSLDISAMSVGLGISRFSQPIEQAYLWYPIRTYRRCKAFRHNLHNAMTARREFNIVVSQDLSIEPIRHPTTATLIHSEFAIPDADRYADSQRQLAASLQIAPSRIVTLRQTRFKSALTSPVALNAIASTVREFINHSHREGIGSD